MRARFDRFLAIVILAAAVQAAAGDPPAAAPVIDTAKMSEGLIYSVNRTPERPFDMGSISSIRTATASAIPRMA
jgi:hypothetical protein